LIPEELQKEIEKRFFEQNKILKPRHQRDIKRLICIIKALALLNLWWRNKNSRTIVAVKSDVNEAFALWEKISVSQELNLPPYIYKLYLEVILPIWNGKNGNRDGEIAEVTGKIGITRQEILQKHFDVYGRMLDGNQLRQQILPMLETCGLIIQESDPSNKRQKLIYPTALFTVSNNKQYSETSSGVLGNSVIQCGVNGLESYPTTELTISPTKQYSENENGVNNAVEIALNVFNGAKVVQYDH
jgi:hypothetical protein